jgi:hypothetical protein
MFRPFASIIRRVYEGGGMRFDWDGSVDRRLLTIVINFGFRAEQLSLPQEGPYNEFASVLAESFPPNLSIFTSKMQDVGGRSHTF